MVMAADSSQLTVTVKVTVLVIPISFRWKPFSLEFGH